MNLTIIICLSYLAVAAIAFIILENNNNQEFDFSEDQRAINTMWATFFPVLLIAMIVLIVFRLPKNLMTYFDLLRRGIPLAAKAMAAMFTWQRLNPFKNRGPYDL